MAQSSWQIASQLLSIEKKRASYDSTGIRLYPAFVGILNLFFCAYMEQYLKNDPQGHYLSLFLLIEYSIVALISVGTFMRSMNELIFKSSVFPSTPLSYLMFVIVGFFRKPVVAALIGGTILFLIVPFASAPFSALLCMVFAVVAFLDIELIVAVLCLRLTRSAQPVAGIAILCVYALIGVVFAAIIFHVNALLDAAPIVSWTVQGIIAIRNGALASAGAPALALLLTLAAALFLGKKIA